MSRRAPTSKGPDEKFCAECGELIKQAAEICPECGVRQKPKPSGARDVQSSGKTSHTQTTTTQSVTTDVGIIFAFMDMAKVKKPARHIVDLLLAFFTVGLYLKILVIEWLWHYYNLKKGKYRPYDENRDKKIWSPTLRG